jgi:hypothetical protein
MKKLLFLSILLCLFVFTNAQRVYFVYLQSDNGTPFYVKLGDKIHSSSSMGYLLLSNLKDSSYSLRIGMSGQNKAEPIFNVAVNNTDRGFLIKNFEQGLSLFDLSTLEIIAAQPVAVKSEEYITRTDNFTKSLSQAANDPSLLTEAVVKKPAPKEKAPAQEKQAEVSKPAVVITESTQPQPRSNDSTLTIDAVAVVNTPEKKEDTSSKATIPDLSSKAIAIIDSPVVAEQKQVADTVQNTVVQKSEPAVVKESETPTPTLNTEELTPYKRSTVIRRSESSTSEGFGLTFVDQFDGVSDTIRLLIPNPRIQLKTETEASAVIESQPSAKPVPVQNDMLMIDKPKAECQSIATENDFRKLRKDMAAQNSDDAMVEKAKRIFRNKCFSTDQIKLLSTLFLSAAGKYKFFDAAYNAVSDINNFGVLQSELNEEYYSNRFKALIGK